MVGVLYVILDWLVVRRIAGTRLFLKLIIPLFIVQRFGDRIG